MSRLFRCSPLLAFGVVPTAMAAIFGSLFAGTMPADLGVRNGRLAACPDKPNCVNSQATDAEHAIAPFNFSGSAATALQTLARIITATPDAMIVVTRDNYLQATFATPTMGFIDDVEFFADPARNIIDVRSASRLGTSDFGVNRNRIEGLRRALAAKKS